MPNPVTLSRLYMTPDSIHLSRHSAHRGDSLNVSGPAIDRPAVKKELEIEAKFFMPRALAQKLTSGLEFTQIEQSYFKRDQVRPLLEQFLIGRRSPSNHGEVALGGTTDRNELASLSIARIRRVRHPEQGPRYFIEFKGSKEGEEGARISRREVSREISAKQYEALKAEASAGTLRKRRYSISGTITVNGRTIPAEAQIDCLQAAGKELHKVSPTFDTVDIELLDPSHIHALREGHHSFEFLKNCIELSSHNKHLAKPLTTRRVAKWGLYREALKAIEQLEAQAHRLTSKKKN